MQFWQANKKLILSTITLVFLWFNFLFYQLIKEEQNNDHLKYIPENTVFMLKINSRSLIKSGMESVFFKHKDNDIYKLIRDLIQKKTEREGIQKNPGIDLTKEIVFFTVPVNQNVVSGYLFSLNNRFFFDKNILEYFDGIHAAASNESVGIVLEERSKKNIQTLSKDELQILAAQFIKEPSGFDMTQLNTIEENNFVAEIWSKQGIQPDADLINYTKFNFAFDKNEILLSGSINLNKERIRNNESIDVLVPNGFHLTTRLISDKVNDTLATFFKNYSFIPRVSAISMNYFGSNIIEKPSFDVIPNCDMLIHFQTNMEMSRLIDTLVNRKLVTNVSEGEFTYGGYKFFYHQPDKKTLYLGRHPFYSSAIEKTDDMMRVSGDASTITRIESKVFKTSFLMLFPIYSASRNLTSAVNKIDITVKTDKNGTAKVLGLVRFKSGKFALNEFMRFGLEAQFFR